jgi:hypothetical protein
VYHLTFKLLFSSRPVAFEVSPSHVGIASRVTIWDEFSSIGSLFTLGSVFKITEVAPIFGLLFSTVPVTY